eukprot:6192533-Pleurochrysis_carterae.AAC.3
MHMPESRPSTPAKHFVEKTKAPAPLRRDSFRRFCIASRRVPKWSVRVTSVVPSRYCPPVSQR